MEFSGYYLPQEVVHKIFTFLTSEDLESCRNVSKRCRSIVGDDYLWRQLCLAKGYYTEDINPFIAETEANSWWELYWFDENWRNGNFIERKIKVCPDEIVRWCQLFGTAFFIVTNKKVKIHNIKEEAQLEQELTPNNRSEIDFFNVNAYCLTLKCRYFVYIYKKNDSYTLWKKLQLKCEAIGTEFNSGSPFQVLFHEFTDDWEEFDSDLDLTIKLHIRLFEDKIVMSVLESQVVCKMEYILCLSTEKLYNVRFCIPSHCILKAEFYWPSYFVAFEEDNIYCHFFGIQVYDVIKNSPAMKLDCGSKKVTIFRHPFNFTISDSFVAVSFFTFISAYLHVWNKLNGNLIYTTKKDRDRTLQHFIIGYIILLRIEEKMFLIDLRKGEQLKHFVVRNAISFNIRLTKHLFATCRDRAEVWDAFSGSKLFSVKLGAVHNSRTDESFYDSARPIENNFRYFCYFQPLKAGVFIFDFSRVQN